MVLFGLLKNMTGDAVLNSQHTQPGGFANQLPGQLPIKQEPLEFQFIWLRI